MLIGLAFILSQFHTFPFVPCYSRLPVHSGDVTPFSYVAAVIFFFPFYFEFNISIRLLSRAEMRFLKISGTARINQQLEI